MKIKGRGVNKDGEACKIAGRGLIQRSRKYTFVY